MAKRIIVMEEAAANHTKMLLAPMTWGGILGRNNVLMQWFLNISFSRLLSTF